MNGNKGQMIHVGDRVRSYDFPDLDGMKTTCYVEGVVEAIGSVYASLRRDEPVPACHGEAERSRDRYTIRITRRSRRLAKAGLPGVCGRIPKTLAPAIGRPPRACGRGGRRFRVHDRLLPIRNSVAAD